MHLEHSSEKQNINIVIYFNPLAVLAAGIVANTNRVAINWSIALLNLYFLFVTQITKLSDTLFSREYDVFISNKNIMNFKSTSSFYLHIARNEFHLLLFQSMLRVEIFTERFLGPAACSS